MCGITGWVTFKSDLRKHQGTVDAMTDTMARRGPDAGGTWVRQHVALGHRRLAIIDLSGGKQPMTENTPTGAVTVVYSGETYNYIELRQRLAAKGHRFRTKSDTEVILRGYLEWGDSLAGNLNGMYALAIWDEREERLTMIRDRLGIKPLYYFLTRDGVLFGSEPKAILANPLAPKAVDIDGLRDLIALTKTPGLSLWQGIREVEPGTIVSVDSLGTRTETYWKLRTSAHEDGLPETIDHIRELMTDIVRRQLVSDVPRCVLLSGGLDSSSITSLATIELAKQGEQLRTYSVDFVGQEENFKPIDGLRGTPDSPFIRDVVKHVGSLHRNVVLDAKDLIEPRVRRAVIRASDMPIGNGDIDASLYLLFEAIRHESTVALSGESADEVFGGYPWFHDRSALQTTVYPWLASWNSWLSERNEAFLPSIRDLLGPERHAEYQYASATAEVEHTNGHSETERQMRTNCYLHLVRHVRTLLDRKDRLSMASGLEVRVPFCDHRLVEYVYNVPWPLKTFDGREKSLLRHAVKTLIPGTVAERPKSGYPSTQDPAYVASLREQAAETLSQKNSPVFDLIDREWLLRVSKVDSGTMSLGTRMGINMALDLYHWFDIYQPELM